MKKVVLILVAVIMIFISGCHKSSGTTPPAACTDAPCLLQAHEWKIFKSVLTTDAGNYSHTAAELAGISWSTFLFNKDLTFSYYNGGGTYTLLNSNTQILAQFPTSLDKVHFDFTATNDGLVLKQLTVQVHPQTDMSAEATGIIAAYLPALHDEFGVDTSTVHSIQAVFSYNVK